MIEPTHAAAAFDAAFRRRGLAGLTVRAESDGDAAFLRALFLANAPMRDLLPAPLLAQQADLQVAAFRHALPQAMRRIVLDEAAAPVGRIIIDWGRSPEVSHCVDIAMRPTHGGRGVGTALLQAWIEVANGLGLACTLEVAPDNPARALYARLGFEEVPEAFASASIAMIRLRDG
jgi:ribosomal protein S18 acetylase RimI-like enzyme